MAKRRSGREIIAKNMRKIRRKRGWSQETLAENSQMHRTYIGAIERQEQNVSIDNIDKIAKAFRITITELLK